MLKPFPTEIEPETAIIVGVMLRDQTELQVQEYLDELAFLAETAGIVVKKIFFAEIASNNFAHIYWNWKDRGD